MSSDLRVRSGLAPPRASTRAASGAFRDKPGRRDRHPSDWIIQMKAFRVTLHALVSLCLLGVTPFAEVAAQGASGSTACAANDTIDRFVASEMTRKHVPGVAIA